MNPDLRVLTAQDIHEEYGLDLSYARRLLKTRKIPVLKSGRKLATLRMHIEEWLKNQGKGVPKTG